MTRTRHLITDYDRQSELGNNEEKKRVELKDTPWSPQEDKWEERIF